MRNRGTLNEVVKRYGGILGADPVANVKTEGFVLRDTMIGLLLTCEMGLEGLRRDLENRH